jgi:hypothetical protein
MYAPPVVGEPGLGDPIAVTRGGLGEGQQPVHVLHLLEAVVRVGVGCLGWGGDGVSAVCVVWSANHPLTDSLTHPLPHFTQSATHPPTHPTTPFLAFPITHRSPSSSWPSDPPPVITAAVAVAPPETDPAAAAMAMWEGVEGEEERRRRDGEVVPLLPVPLPERGKEAASRSSTPSAA